MTYFLYLYKEIPNDPQISQLMKHGGQCNPRPTREYATVKPCLTSIYLKFNQEGNSLCKTLSEQRKTKLKGKKQTKNIHYLDRLLLKTFIIMNSFLRVFISCPHS